MENYAKKIKELLTPKSRGSEINGNDINYFHMRRRTTKDVVMAYGKGVSFVENKVNWHGVSPKKEELEKALKELDNSLKTL